MDLIAKPARWCPGLRDGHPVARSLVGLWPFWEGQGDKVYDVANPFNIGNHDILSNMDPATDWVATEYGVGLDCGSSVLTEQVLLPATLAAGQTHLALSAWVRITKTDGDNDLWVYGEHAAEEPLLVWYDNAATDKWAFLVTATGGQTSGVVYSSGSAIANAWCHVYFEFTPGQVRLFINGIEDGSSPFAVAGVGDIDPTPAEGPSTFRFGDNGKGNTNNTFVGRVMHMAAWHRPLFASEIHELYANPWGLITPRKRTYFYVTAPPSGIVVLRRRMEAA